MSIVYAIILGIIQGVTEFLPVSSFGHSSVLRSWFGLSGNFGILFSVFLHLGTLTSIYLMFQKDIRQILRELPGLLSDLLKNLGIYFKNRRSDRKQAYVKVVRTASRKLTVMVLLGCVPTFLLGYTAKRLVFLWSLSSVMTAIGFFLTGVVLLVVDLGGSTGKKEIREASYDHAMWMGICQGLSVFPGISRCGLTVSTGLFCGLSMRFAVKLSYLMSVPAVLGAFVSRLGDFSSPALHANTVVSCIVGMIAAAVTGYYAIRFVMKKLRQIRFRYFAVYCFLAGILTLIGNFM